MPHIVGNIKHSACKGCRSRVEGPEPFEIIDYKNIRLLQKCCTPQGKMYGRKRSGFCHRCQQVMKQAVKRARFLGLLSYVGQK